MNDPVTNVLVSIGALAIAVLLSTSSPLKAQPLDDWDLAKPHTDKCSVGSQRQMNRCLASEKAQAKARLAALYQDLLAKQRDPSRLADSQAAWRLFRDRSCEYAVSGLMPDGDLNPYIWDACEIDLTEKRIRDLQRYVEWGDCNGCAPWKR